VALADYFQRSALAVAQIAHGYDEKRLSELLGSTSVAVSIGDEPGPEAEALADLIVRLVSRLYPRVALLVRDSHKQEELGALAREINPRIELCEERGDLGIVVGSGDEGIADDQVFVGSDGWNALLSTRDQMLVGGADNPFGAGVAACLGVSWLFRRLIAGGPPSPGEPLVFSAWACELGDHPNPDVRGTAQDAVLVGGGAIGNAASWALSRAPLAGALHIVDNEGVELSNLQRYVLTTRRDHAAAKAEFLAAHFTRTLRALPVNASWQEFVADNGYDWQWALAALDSARDRRAVQASLPKHVLNAWTQPGDLGVSAHPSFDGGACLSCLYLPTGQVPNQDELVAGALGLDHARFGLQIRQLLEAGDPPPRELLDIVAPYLDVARDQIVPYEKRPLRDLYVEGICGGGLVPLARIGVPDQELHVPLAHQSALAGVLLAARFARMVAGGGPEQTLVTRLNIMREVPPHPTQPAAKRGDGVCICEDPVYAVRYEQKWGDDRSLPPV
jgi:hypothetical protein